MKADRSYAAFLRGVMPTNAKMSELALCFEAAGVSGVRTVLGSGNVVFTAGARPTAALEKQVEAAMGKHLGRTFLTLVRPIHHLQAILDQDPFAGFPRVAKAKRVVTFLRQPAGGPSALPIKQDGVRILRALENEIFSDYVPNPRGPVFMQLIKRLYGEDCTTRTWDTVVKVVKAAGDTT